MSGEEHWFGSFRDVALHRLKVSVQRQISNEMVYMARTAEAHGHLDRMYDRMVLDLRAKVLAEQLPPQTITHTVRVEALDPRHATWWEFFKATYRQRWWMRWRDWTVRYVDTPVTVQRSVVVKVRDHWTYPRASIIPPDTDFGAPVMVSIWGAEDFRS